MNNIFCSCAVALLAIGFSTTAQADILFHNNTSSIKIESKPNLNSISKPNSSIKLASVQFLTDTNNVSFDSGNIDIKTQCMVSGYVLPVSNCNALDKNSGILCPLNNGEYQYTDKCCDKVYDKTEGTNCSNNAILSSDYCLRGAADSAIRYYKCECPESAYPYAQDEDCPAGHRINYDPTKTCEVDGVKRYSTCIPKSYLDCSQEGSINGVTGLLGNYGTGYGYLQDGTIVFAECRCPTDYSNYGCSTFLLSSDVCKSDGRTYYKDGDCYGGCTDASLYDADYYYKQFALRCLFDYNTEEKTYSNLININKTNTDKALCTRVVNGQEQVSRQTCTEMGYVYSEDECPDKDNLLIRCPSDTSKVWCMNANGCMNYPVGGSACNEGAKVSYCGSDKTRCVYDESTCNKNWNDGIRNGSYAGSTSLCCKDGWDFIDGVCTPHDCGDVDYLYPYGDRYPLVEVAEGGSDGISSCKSGDKWYYGYKQCKGCAYGDTYASNTCTDLWQPSVDNPHRCVCKTTGLPYDRNTLYTQGGSGNLGVMKTCVDPDATYYGYDYCYRWYAMEYSDDVATGKCGDTSCDREVYPYDIDTISTESVRVSGVCSTEDEAGCANGNDEACHTCIDANSPYVIICNYGTATAQTKDKFYGYKTCPPERPYQADTYICYNKCAFGSADCKRGDAVFYPDVANGKFIGTVIKVSENIVYLMGPKQGSYTWEEARIAGANYYPEGLENDANVGKSKWCLMKGIGAYVVGPIFGNVHERIFTKEGYSWGWNFWIDAYQDNDYAYVLWTWGTRPYLKTSEYPMVPMITYKKPEGE